MKTRELKARLAVFLNAQPGSITESIVPIRTDLPLQKIRRQVHSCFSLP